MFENLINPVLDKAKGLVPKALQDRIFLLLLRVFFFFALISSAGMYVYEKTYNNLTGASNFGVGMSFSFLKIFSEAKMFEIILMYTFFYVLIAMANIIQERLNEKKNKLLNYIVLFFEVIIVGIFVYLWGSFTEPILLLMFVTLFNNLLVIVGVQFKKIIGGKEIGISLVRTFIIIPILLFGFTLQVFNLNNKNVSKDIEKSICSNMKVMNFRTKSNHEYMGWYISSDDHDYYMKEKTPQGIYQMVILSKNSVDAITDFSFYDFSDELKLAFKGCK